MPMQWLLRTPHCTGNNPMNVATSNIIIPTNPVKRYVSIITNVIVIFINNIYGTFAKCFANILPILSVKKYDSIPASIIAINR